MFIHEQVGLTDMESVTTESGRRYQTPDGAKFPSITTVLSILSRDSIAKWRKRVGEEEANKISHRASTRGTAVHEICEKYVNNDPDYLMIPVINSEGETEMRKATPDLIQSFLDLKPILDTRLTKVYAQEAPLYSNHLGVAGRVDCVGIFDGKLSIIDYKTAKKPKQAKWITNYFMQETFYAIAWEELTGMPITQLVTIVSVDQHEPQVFVEHRDNWVRPLKETIEKYKSEQPDNSLFG